VNKLRHITKSLLLTALFVLAFCVDISAQCAMCKAVAEDTMNDGFGVAMGLNSGIILIMFVPYALLAILFVTFFGGRIKGFLKEFSRIH
jgi:hypothetical protein